MLCWGSMPIPRPVNISREMHIFSVWDSQRTACLPRDYWGTGWSSSDDVESMLQQRNSYYKEQGYKMQKLLQKSKKEITTFYKRSTINIVQQPHLTCRPMLIRFRTIFMRSVDLWQCRWYWINDTEHPGSVTSPTSVSRKLVKNTISPTPWPSAWLALPVKLVSWPTALT